MTLSAAAALHSCKPPKEKIVPMVEPAEYMKPGKENYFSTVYTRGAEAYDLVVKTVDGRPIKADREAGTNARMQAATYSLYDPRRFREPRVDYDSTDTDTAMDKLKERLADGETRILIGEHCSPALDALIGRIELENPNLRFVTIPASFSMQAEINETVLGRHGEFVPNLDKTELIVSIGWDFLGTEPFSVWQTRDFAKSRRPEPDNIKMNRLICVEPFYTLTGAKADKRIVFNPAEMSDFIILVLSRVAENKGLVTEIELPKIESRLSSLAEKVADELLEFPGKSIIQCASWLPEPAQATCLLINLLTENFGKNKALDPARFMALHHNKESYNRFLKELEGGDIDNLVFADCNPFYFGRQDLITALDGFKIQNMACLSLYPDETAQKCGIFIPMSHFMESWGDAISFDSNKMIRQPVILPLNKHSLSLGDFLIKLTDVYSGSWYDFIRERYAGLDDPGWESALRKGYISKDGNNENELNPDDSSVFKKAKRILNKFQQEQKSGLTLFALPTVSVGHGSFVPPESLMELPDPITKQVWGNSAMISRELAKKQGLKDGHEVEIKTEKGNIRLPVLIIQGTDKNTVAVYTGFGRRIHGQKTDEGENSYNLLISITDNFEKIISLNKTEKVRKQALAQIKGDYRGRDALKEIKPKELLLCDLGKSEPKKSIYPERNKSETNWGMVIDMSACTGCGACIEACRVENNIPLVGPNEASNGRIMDWMRIDRYFSDAKSDDPSISFLAMLCQHCDLAPCESVCPVSASSHSPEGLNETTYNRCVGTRYCIANCPYKVRKFNYYEYSDYFHKQMNLSLNPRVTVRMRGIVEKCSFCVQRINQSRMNEGAYGKHISVKTACQEACPAGAIHFGNLNDPDSAVSRLSKSGRAFTVLENLNTRPSVTYLANVRNEKA